MAESLNVIRRERKKGFRRIKQSLRTLDTAVEATQRFVDRKLRLKTALIEANDLEKVIDFLKGVEVALRAVISILEAIRGIFS